MVAFSMYRGNLHIGGRDSGAAAERRWERPRPTLSAKRFRRLLRNRSLAIARLAGAPRRPGSPSSADVDGARGAAEHDEEARHDEEADGVDEQGGQEQQDEEEEPQQQGENGHGEEEQQHQAEEEQQEEGAVEDADMDDAGEIVVEGDGNGDAEEGQGESEGVDPNQEEVRVVRILGSRIPNSLTFHDPCAAIVIVLAASDNHYLVNTFIPRSQSILLGN
jgi:hypothetical protein